MSCTCKATYRATRSCILLYCILGCVSPMTKSKSSVWLRMRKCTWCHAQLTLLLLLLLTIQFNSVPLFTLYRAFYIHFIAKVNIKVKNKNASQKNITISLVRTKFTQQCTPTLKPTFTQPFAQPRGHRNGTKRRSEPMIRW